MSADFILLQCPNCAAKLEVYDDMERFTCGYCKTEVLVQRRGGTIALRTVTAAIERVQQGTDRTAGELTLVRLERESEELSARLATLGSEASQRETGYVVEIFGLVLVAVLICGVLAALNMGWWAAGAAIVTIVALLGMGRVEQQLARDLDARETERLKERNKVVDQLATLNARIAELKQRLS